MVESELHVLYRMWSACGELLYVGVTCNPGYRLNAHANGKNWWREVASVTMEHFPSRSSLLDAELQAIRVENPRYNIAGRPSELMRQRYLSALETRRARGLHIGRPKALSTEKAGLAHRMRAEGEPVTTIAEALGISRATAYRVLSESR